MKTLFKSLAILTSFSVLTRALGFLFRIFLSRIMGPEDLGIYQISFSIFMVLETFIASGLPLIISKNTAHLVSLKQEKKQGELIASALLVGLFTAIFLCLIVLLFKNTFALMFTDKRCLNILITLLPALVFSSVYAVLRGNLWGQKKYFWVSITEFFEQLFRILFCVVLFATFNYITDKTQITALSYVLSCLFSSIVVFIVYIKNHGRFSKPNKQTGANIIKASVPITFVRVVSSLLVPLISIIIPMQLVNTLGYSNSQALSIFGIAMGMTFPLLYIPSTLVGSLSTTLIPDLSSATIQKQNVEINTKIDFAIKFGFFVAFMFIPIFTSVGNDIGLFLYNEVQSGIFLKYSSVLIIPICLSTITVSCLNALGLELKGFINYIVGAFFLLVCITFLTKYLAIYSLVWGMGLCLGIATILNIKMLNKKQNKNFFNFGYLFKLIVCSLPSFLITKWLNNLLKCYVSLFFSLSISCLVGELFFLIFGIILNLVNLSFLNFKRRKIKQL